MKAIILILLIFLIIKDTYNHQFQPVNIETKYIVDNNKCLLRIQIINNSNINLYFPKYSLRRILKIYDLQNKNITDSVLYIIYRVSGPTKFTYLTDVENSNYISSYNTCYNYDSVKLSKFKVNKVIKKGIEIDYKNILTSKLNNLYKNYDEKVVKQYLLQKYCSSNDIT